MRRSILDTDTRLTDLDISRRLGVHKATACRWRVRGIPLPDGSRLRLAYTRAGKRAYVHPDDLRDFLARLTEADERAHAQRDCPQAAVTPTSPGRSSSRAEQAEREADEMGL